MAVATLSAVTSGLRERGRPHPHGTWCFCKGFDALAFETTKLKLLFVELTRGFGGRGRPRSIKPGDADLRVCKFDMPLP